MTCLILCTATAIYFTQNPIYSLMFLITTFLLTSAILFSNIAIPTFIPLAFILIYVGAIAILFLFILMLINLRSTFNRHRNPLYSFLICQGLITFIAMYLVKDSGYTLKPKNLDLVLESFNFLDDLSLFGLMFEPFCFFLIAFMLLTPLFAVLAVAKQDRRSRARQQRNTSQTSRSVRTVGMVIPVPKKM